MRSFARPLFLIVAAAMAAGIVPPSASAAFDVPLAPSTCVAGKVKCVAKLESCLLRCHRKAVSKGLAVDPSCVTKCRDNFERDPAVPGKGCFARLEAKGGCGASVGDAAWFAAATEAHVLDAVGQLVPGGGTPRNPCTAGKINCHRKYGSCLLGRVRKAAKDGTLVADPAECARFLDVDAGSCTGKLETKHCEGCDADPCLTFGDGGGLRHQDDAFTEDAIAALEVGPTDMDTQRCSGDTSVACASAPGGVVGCGGALGTCEFFFGAPLPYSLGGIAACVTRQWSGSISGTFDQATGASAGVATALSCVFVGGNSIAAPCPRCVGDAYPNDGNAGGFCDAGSRVGLACDGNGRAPEPSFGVTSLDCPPVAASNVGTFTLDLSNATGAVVQTVTAASPDCNGAPGKKCLCAGCSGDPSVPCRTDADCALAGVGTCTSNAGEPRRPNTCFDDTTVPGDGTLCAPMHGNEGVCAEGPVESHCAIETFRACGQASDCPAAGDVCTSSLRDCFPGYDGNVGDTIVATGRPGSGRNGAGTIAFGAVYCVGLSSTLPISSAVNTAAGFPGPARLELAGVAEDDGGSACPTRASFLPTSRGPVADVGWTGLLHDQRAVAGAKVTVATTCTGAPPTCACSYTGPIPNPNTP